MEISGANAIAGNVRRLMEHRGWTQRELAKRAGLSQSGVGYLLRYKDVGDRHPTTETIDAVAKAFGVQPWMLMIPDVALSTFTMRPTDQAALTKAIATGTTAGMQPSQAMGFDRRILKESVGLLNDSIAAHESSLPADEYVAFLIELYNLFTENYQAVPGKVVDINTYIARRTRQGGSNAAGTRENRRHRKSPS